MGGRTWRGGYRRWSRGGLPPRTPTVPAVKLDIIGIPVTVRWSFWPVALLIVPLPYSLLARPRAWGFVAVWLGVVFVTVLVHELAHAVTARSAGAETSITLYFLGGFTTWEASDIGHGRRAWVAASGSLAGFVMGGLAWWLLESGVVPSGVTHLMFGLENFWYVNLVWGALNWIPVRPLDGGHMFASAVGGVLGDRGTRVTAVVFPLVTIVAGGMALLAGLYVAAAFALLVLVGEAEVWRGRNALPIGPGDEGGGDEYPVG